MSEWNVIKEPTCTVEGRQERICTICNKKEEKAVQAKNHIYGEWLTTKTPTCTVEGRQERICTICNEKEEKPVQPKGHTYDNWTTTKDATTTQNGEQQRICSDCKNVEIKVKVYETPKTGDTIVLYIITSIIAIIGIYGTTKILKKKNKKS